jgi:hypothetical protein
LLDAGIQDVSTSISIVHDLPEKHKFSKGVMMAVVYKGGQVADIGQVADVRFYISFNEVP